MSEKAIIYTRFSPRPNAGECDSCEKQQERCVEYCKKKGYFPQYSHHDKDVSGSDLIRDGLSCVMELLRDTNCKVVVIDTVDRLARDMLVGLTIRHEIEKAGGRIEFADGTPAESTPESKLILNILSAFAAYERDRIRHRTKRAFEKKKAKGEKFGKPPIGWKRHPDNSKTFIENKHEQECIKEILLCHELKELNSDRIACHLNRNFGLFRGKAWSPRTIRKVIRENS